jgi:hypothetical protein
VSDVVVTYSARALTAGFAFVVYFGLLLIPEWRPGILTTAPYFVYLLALPLTLFGLVLVGCWGTVGLLLGRRRRSTVQAKHRAMLSISAAGMQGDS